MYIYNTFPKSQVTLAARRRTFRPSHAQHTQPDGRAGKMRVALVLLCLGAAVGMDLPSDHAEQQPDARQQAQPDEDNCAVIDTQQSSKWQAVPGDPDSPFQFSWRVQVLDWQATTALTILWPQAIELESVQGGDLVSGAKSATTVISLGPMAPAHNTIQIMGKSIPAKEGANRADFGPETTHFICRTLAAPPPLPPLKDSVCDLNPTFTMLNSWPGGANCQIHFEKWQSDRVVQVFFWGAPPTIMLNLHQAPSSARTSTRRAAASSTRYGSRRRPSTTRLPGHYKVHRRVRDEAAGAQLADHKLPRPVVATAAAAAATALAEARRRRHHRRLHRQTRRARSHRLPPGHYPPAAAAAASAAARWGARTSVAGGGRG